MEENTKINILFTITIIMSILLGASLTIAYDNNRINGYIEQTALSYQKAVDYCKYNYNVNAELKELDDKYTIEFKEVKDE